jgi:peptide/nickel transport system permease protein
MLNEAQSLTALDPLLALFPGFAVVLLVLGLNLMGDGLRRREGAGR